MRFFDEDYQNTQAADIDEGFFILLEGGIDEVLLEGGTDKALLEGAP